MATNGFESSRISEGTMHAGAQHVSNLPRPMFDTPRDPGTKEVLNGHPVLTEQTMAPRILRADNLVGADVYNREGEKLGRIEDLLIDFPQGRVAYAALSFGGFLGIGDKLFMIPWSALVYDSHANRFLLEIDREALEKAPGFDKDRWPDMANPAYGAEIHRHYGRKPYWAGNVTDFSSEEFAANRCCE
jgi:sporulation protein YlmC with PRC-barrel domain